MIFLFNANWLIWLGTLWLLWMPGWLLARLLRLPKSPDPLVRLALQVGLGLAFWPVLLLWTSTIGWQWSQITAQVFVLLLSASVVYDLVRAARKQGVLLSLRLHRFSATLALFAFILFLTVWTRVLHIWGLALPAWVDSVHHAMIIRLLVEHGALPATYDPFIPGGSFFYHWGYHAIITWIVWSLGRAEPLAITQIMLHAGQVLNSLTVLMLYAAGRVMFQNRRAGLLAALLAGLISWFPAFYVTWGRYPQVVALLVLCAFGIMLWQLHVRPTWGRFLGVEILAAGLLLIHIRVAFFALTLVTVLVGWLLLCRAWRTLGRWVAAGLCSLLLTLPWLFTLLDYGASMPLLIQATSSTGVGTLENYFGIQPDLLWAPHNRELLALATGGLSGLAGWGAMPRWGQVLSGCWLLFLIGCVPFSGTWSSNPKLLASVPPKMWYAPFLIGLVVWQRLGHRWLFLLNSPLQRRQPGWKIRLSNRLWSAVGIIFAWCILTAGVLNLNRLQLPQLTLVHNNSALIALFLPLSLTGGGLLAWAIRRLITYRWVMPITAFLIIAGGGWGAVTMIDIISPVTTLATAADVEAMQWIRINTPPDAIFAVNVWPWLGQTYAGADGGYWIQVVTDRKTIVPPALYTAALPAAVVKPINALLALWEQSANAHPSTLRAVLQASGVTYVYLGAHSDPRQANYFRQQDWMELVYQNGSVYIFAWKKT